MHLDESFCYILRVDGIGPWAVEGFGIGRGNHASITFIQSHAHCQEFDLRFLD